MNLGRRNLAWLFRSTRELKRELSSLDVPPVERLAVLGAGIMGCGIASISAGLCPVVLRDVDDAVLSRSARAVDEELGKLVETGSICADEASRRRSRIELTDRLEAIRGADLVIETVPEDPDLKRRVLREVEEQVSPSTVITSNTSALPITELGEGLRSPERLLGSHYFSPVHKMPLLEVVATEWTSKQALDTARAFGARQDKVCISVRDGRGFYTTRALSAYLNEALLLVEEGASIEQVDGAMQGFGYSVGPLALIDEVGIDVGAHVAVTMGSTFSFRGLTIADTLPRLLKRGYLGRRNGRGFYSHTGEGRGAPNTGIYRDVTQASRRWTDPEEIRGRLAYLLVNEVAYCLQEGVVASPGDGDIAAIMGLGFPPATGGPFHFVDATGAGAVVDRLHELAGRYGPRFRPAPILVEMSRLGRRFYE